MMHSYKNPIKMSIMQPAPSQNDNQDDTEVFGALLGCAVGIVIGIVDAAGDDDDLWMLEDVLLPSYLVWTVGASREEAINMDSEHMRQLENWSSDCCWEQWFWMED
jgi:hypothetical protein